MANITINQLPDSNQLDSNDYIAVYNAENIADKFTYKATIDQILALKSINVNGKTGNTITLVTDDISDSGSLNKFVTSAEKAKISIVRNDLGGSVFLAGDGTYKSISVGSTGNRNYTFNTISERDLETGINNGDRALVIDASDDATVDTGAALYYYNAILGTWNKLAEVEALDIEVASNVSAGNGLTKSGDTITLGGALTGDTAILGNYKLTLGSSIEPLSGLLVETSNLTTSGEIDLISRDSVDNSIIGRIYTAANDVTGLYQTDGSNSSEISVEAVGISLASLDDTSQVTRLEISSTGSVTTESEISGFKGIEYGANYSNNYSPRSLVDKGFVDSRFIPRGGSVGLFDGLSIDSSGHDVLFSGSDTSFGFNIGGDNVVVLNVGRTPYSTTSLEGFELLTLSNSISEHVVGIKGVGNSFRLGAFNITSPETDQLYIEATTDASDNNNLKIVDNRSVKKGIEYAGNYSSSFSPRSLVDKGYVTGLTSSIGGLNAANGLTKIGNTIVLGGTITGDTTTQIDYDYSTEIGYNIKVVDTTSPDNNASLELNTGFGSPSISMKGSNALGFGYFTTDASGNARFGYDKGAGNSLFLIANGDSGAFTFNDERTIKSGIEYADDYSNDFTDLSLVNKGYVSNRFWNLSGTSIISGGDVTIDGSGSNNLYIGGFDLSTAVNDFGVAATNVIDMQVDDYRSGLNIDAGSASLYAGSGLGLNYGSLEFNSDGITFEGKNSSNTTLSRFVVGAVNSNFTDSRSVKKGIEYAGNYSSSFSPRSLVDKGFVTGLTSNIITGSTGSIDNAILRSDGTSTKSVQSSNIFISDSANLTLGSNTLTGASRTITASSSATNASLRLSGQGTGLIELAGGLGSTTLALGGSADSGSDRQITVQGSSSDITLQLNSKGSGGITLFSSGDNAPTRIFKSNSSTNNISKLLRLDRQSSGTVADGFGSEITIDLENAAGTLNPAFNLQTSWRNATLKNSATMLQGYYNDLTVPYLLMDNKNIAISRTSVSNWQSMQGGLLLNNIIVEPTTAIDNGVALYSKDSSSGSANSTLALRTEQAVEVIGTFTASHKLKIWINGVEYRIQLEAV